MNESQSAKRLDRVFRLALVLLVVLWGALSERPAHPALAKEAAPQAKELRS